ncbi:hypothetical protein CSQ85_04495 [Bifidobacterium rousetti]|uniref:hypothetical protein n=1 Tax=Bifidobacterium rousetti TaxID=2045439 RepID=UPI001238ED9F|nr:hypothetical protein [Bifidobacterium rousetti]KAA8819938.1 hypothetical protein CSQ85_04495 [Bifidobacterium rousetti]
MKKTIVAVLATIIATLGLGLAAGTAVAEPYGANVTVSGTTATVTFQSGTFEPNETVTVTWDDNVIRDVQQIGARTFNAKSDGSLSLRYIFQPNQAGQTVTVTVSAASGTHSATVTLPATGAGDQSGDSSASGSGTTGSDTTGGVSSITAGATVAKTGAAIAPYGVAAVLLAAAGVALFAVRKTSRR